MEFGSSSTSCTPGSVMCAPMGAGDRMMVGKAKSERSRTSKPSLSTLPPRCLDGREARVLRKLQTDRCGDLSDDSDTDQDDCWDQSTVCHTTTMSSDLSDWTAWERSSELGSPMMSKQNTLNLDFARSMCVPEEGSEDSDDDDTDWEANRDDPDEEAFSLSSVAIEPPHRTPIRIADAVLSILEDEVLDLVPAAETPPLAAVSRSLHARLGADFFLRRLCAVPREVLHEAQVFKSERGAGAGAADVAMRRAIRSSDVAAIAASDAPQHTAAEPAFCFADLVALPPRRVAALEARGLLSEQERARLDYALCVAAHIGAPCRPLLISGAHPNTRSSGRTPLAIAAASGHLSAVRTLLEESADVEARDPNGDRPLVTALVNCHTDIVRLLLSFGGASPEAPDAHGDSPLICAVLSGQAEMVEALLEAKVDVEAPDRDGDTPLICAAVNGQAEAIRALVRGGADVEASDEGGGDVPLIRAATYGHRLAVEALLECNARLDVTDSDGRNALEVAAEHGHSEVVSLLADVWKRAQLSAAPAALSARA